MPKKQEDLKIEKRKLGTLKPAEYNPRVDLHPGDPEYEKIKRSIQTFGYVDPIIINADGTIIGGHQRYKVLRDLGYEEAQVVVLDLSKDDEKALNVALNKISGDWDPPKLKQLFLDLDLNNYDFTKTGFSTQEVQDLVIKLERNAEDDGFDADAEAKKVEAQPVSRRGDLWILGENRLLCGDSTDPEDVDRLMAGDRADLVVVDPPYNVDYQEKNEWLHDFAKSARQNNTIRNDSISDKDFTGFLLDFFGNASAAMKDGAAIYVFYAEQSVLPFREAFKESGLKFSETLIWEKDSFVIGRSDYQWRHEPIIYGWKEGAPHYFIDDRKQDTILQDPDTDLTEWEKEDLITYIRELEGCLQSSVIQEKRPYNSKLHPTMKPIPLIGRLIKNSSKPGELVADFFGGSGSTLIAAQQLGRTAYLMELEPKYCDIIVNRWEEYTGEQAQLVRAADE